MLQGLRWSVEAPRVIGRVMRVGTTRHSDAELEHMRQWERHLYGLGLTMFFTGTARYSSMRFSRCNGYPSLEPRSRRPESVMCTAAGSHRAYEGPLS